MGFNQKYNKNNIFNRSIIAGLVNYLNNKVFFINQLSNNSVDVIQVPFYFSFTGDQSMIQKNFTSWDDCKSPKFADGNYERIPRGVVQLESKTIESSSITQRFIRGTYTKEIDGRLETFNANINPIPYVFSFQISVISDTFTDLSKIEDAIIEAFFRVNIFNVNFRGFMLSCQLSWPESGNVDLHTEYTFPADETQNFKKEFSVEVHTYYPIVDAPGIVPETIKFNLDGSVDEESLEYTAHLIDSNDIREGNRNASDEHSNRTPPELSTEIHNSQRMHKVIPNFKDNEKTEINIVDPIHDTNFALNSDIPISWVSNSEIHYVNILTSKDGVEWEMIQHAAQNSGYFMLYSDTIHSIPINIFDDNGKDAILTASVNGLGGISKINILNQGSFYSQKTLISIDTINGSGAELIPEIINGQIIGCSILNSGSGYDPTPIETLMIRIEDTANTKNYDTISVNLI